MQAGRMLVGGQLAGYTKTLIVRPQVNQTGC